MIWHLGILSVQRIDNANAPGPLVCTIYVENLDKAPIRDDLTFRQKMSVKAKGAVVTLKVQGNP